MRIVNKESLQIEKVQNKETQVFSLYPNGMDSSVSAHGVDAILHNDVEMTAPKWVGSAGYNKLWNEIGSVAKRLKSHMENGRLTNAAQAPAQSEINEFVSKIFLDITRRRMTEADLTTEVATEITNPDFQREVFLNTMLPYVGELQEIQATGDGVPLIKAATGSSDFLELKIYGVGWKTSLANMLFNPLHEMQKVTEAVANADVDLRNSKTVGAILGATYVAAQKQAADTTAGASYDTKLYTTLVNAIEKIKTLKTVDGKAIKSSKLALLINSNDRWALERVSLGQLQSGSGTGIVASVVHKLPIDSLIEYDEGITHGQVRGKTTLDFPGVEPGKAYLFVPKEAFWVANKRGLTMETGIGSVLELAVEERAWYRVQGEYTKHFLGSSAEGADAVTAKNPAQGYVIEVTLPTK